MRRILLIVVMFMLCSATRALAQDRTISGKITSRDDNSSLPGVNVVVKGTTIGSVTDADGNYSISVPSNAETLVFTFIGLRSMEVAIDGRSRIDVQLEADVTQLTEVVIVGYQSLKKTEVSGAIGGGDGKSIKNLPVSSIDRALQGRTAGIQITSSNGIPGGNTQVRIRGVGSVSGSNEPLYIVDGVQMTPGDRSRRLISSNALNGINFNDIESWYILKDAAAAAIYGAQAANGVIIITTKRGKSGAVKFNANYYYGQTDMIQRQSLTDSKQWLDLYEEGQRNFYEPYNAVYGEGFNTRFAKTVTQVNFGEASAAATYDWQNLVTRKGEMHNIDLSATGGTEKNTFYLSASFNKQNSQFLATDFLRGNFKANIDNQLTKKLYSKTSLTFSTVTQNTQGVSGFNTNNAIVGAVGRLPMANPFLSNGDVNPSLTYAIGPLGNLSNPLWTSKVNLQKGTTNQFLGNYNLGYNITNDLTFNSIYSLEYTVIDESAFFDPRTPGGAGTNGSAQMLNTRTINWQTDQTLNYIKTFNDRHNINSLLGFTYRNQITEGFNATGTAIANTELKQTLVGTTANAVGSIYGKFKLSGLFARINYTLDEKYNVSLTVRRDGSSRFGSGKKFGVFPSIAASWRMNKENFMSGVGFVNELKWRASYGVTGNQEIASDFPISLFGTGTAFAYASQGGLSFTNLGNPDLQWEENRTLNFGLDVELFNRRVIGTVDYFVRTTENLLLPQILPSHSGFGSITENVGSLENKGWEFGITTENLVGEVRWSTDFNITFIKNSVKELLNPKEDLPNNSLWLGKPLGQIFVARYAGVNAADGRAMWYDVNGNITYDPQEGDRVFVTRGSGSALIPDYYGGLTNTLSFKGFELSAFLQFNIGQLASSNFKANSSMDYRFDTNQDVEMLERWSKPGDITDVPRIMPGAQEVGSANSLFGGSISGHDRFWEDASYVRLKQLSAAYTLPSNLTNKLKLSSARVYLQGLNLWTKTEFTGFDPEFAANTSNIGVLPPGKAIIAGIEFGF